jgi:hypothetical protein
MLVPVAQLKARPVFGHGGAEILNPLDTVHSERGLIRPGQRLVWLNQDNTVTQARNDQLKLVVADPLEGMVFGHEASLNGFNV